MAEFFNMNLPTVLLYLLCSMLILLILLVAKRKKFGADPPSEVGLKTTLKDSAMETCLSMTEIPDLSPLEAALFLKDRHMVILLLTISLVLKGMLVIENPCPLRLRKNCKNEEGESPVEREFLLALDSEGGMYREGLNKVVILVVNDLAEKLWLCDKMILRRFLQDKIELLYDGILERKGIDTPGELLFMLIHKNWDDDAPPQSLPNGTELLSAPDGSPLPLKSAIKLISQGIYEAETVTGEFSETEVERLFGC